jgi:hypothetical protein
MRTVNGVVLWQAHDPRARAEDIARAAAADDAFTVLGLGDSIMYGVGQTKEQTYLELIAAARESLSRPAFGRPCVPWRSAGSCRRLPSSLRPRQASYGAPHTTRS